MLGDDEMAEEERTKQNKYIIDLHNKIKQQLFHYTKSYTITTDARYFLNSKKRKVILLYHLLIFNSTPCYTLQKLNGCMHIHY